MGTVAELFDEKASAWARKYALGGRLLKRLERFEAELRPKVPPPATLLDLGCGTGNLAAHLERDGYRVTGADISPRMLARAKKGFPRSGVKWVGLSPAWKRLPFDDASFEAVLASSLMEYVDDVAHVTAECARVLRRNGWLLFTVPNLEHPVRRAESVLRLALELAPPLRRAATRLHRAEQYARYLELSQSRLDSDAWRAALAEIGLVLEPPSGRRRDPLWLFAAQKRAP